MLHRFCRIDHLADLLYRERMWAKNVVGGLQSPLIEEGAKEAITESQTHSMGHSRVLQIYAIGGAPQMLLGGHTVTPTD